MRASSGIRVLSLVVAAMVLAEIGWPTAATAQTGTPPGPTFVTVTGCSSGPPFIEAPRPAFCLTATPVTVPPVSAATASPAPSPHLMCPERLPLPRPVLVVLEGKPLSSAWQTYRNVQAGYELTYPGSWTVRECSGARGSWTTTFSKTGGSADITVVVRPGTSDGAAANNPHEICRHVQLAHMPAVRCLDTVASRTSTTLVAHGKTYIIATWSERRAILQIYLKVLRSFRLLS